MTRCRRVLSLGYLLALALFADFMWATTASADDIVFPAGGMSRNHPGKVVYRLDKPRTGNGILSLEWTDTYGRLVERQKVTLRFVHSRVSAFHLDTRRGVAMQNNLRAHLSFRGARSGSADDHESDVESRFILRPPDHAWSDYQIIMWQPHTTEQNAALKKLGVTVGTVIANRGDQGPTYMEAQASPLLANDLRWYIENTATDFYSAYHRWSSPRPENWRFLETKKRYQENLSDPSAFVRDPSLSDPTWLRRIHDRLVGLVRSQKAYRPLFYDLGDETGIADLAAFWDFDLSRYSLTGMRQWLRRQYANLTALNAQWGSHFLTWDHVVPMLTTQAMARKDDNFSAWADFKAWMDIAFASAIRIGTDAIHSADPGAISAIEGAQIPGWGGYDYSLLAKSVDAMELYDAGNNIDIARSLNPNLAILTTASGLGAADLHRIWRSFLRGSRGLILWDENQNLVRTDGGVGPLGQAIQTPFAELRGGLGMLLINSRRPAAPVAILYSPTSFRTQWMLDQMAKGDAWVERDAEAELQENTVRVVVRAYATFMQEAGIPYEFISSGMIERGALSSRRYRVLLLPHAIALSRSEAFEISQFAARGGLVVADEEPGTFDNHSSRLSHPLLHDLFVGHPQETTFRDVRGKARYVPIEHSTLKRESNGCADQVFMSAMLRALSGVRVRPSIPVRGATANGPTHIRSYLFQNGGVTILALQQDICSPSGASEMEPSTDVSVHLSPPHGSFVYDVRDKHALRRADQLELKLRPIEPSILAFSKTALPAPSISGPKHAHPGDIVSLRIGFREYTPAAANALHIEAIDPSGMVIPWYSGNLLTHRKAVTRVLPLALNDPLGRWQILAVDALSGQSATWELQVTNR